MDNTVGLAFRESGLVHSVPRKVRREDECLDARREVFEARCLPQVMMMTL
jgi:hypothetical protein